MNTQSEEDLIESICSYAEWRKHELENLKKIGIERLYNHTKLQEQFYKMSIPYIYAHWEGFVAEAFKELINFLNKLNLDTNSVRDSLVTFSLLENLKPLKGNQSFGKCNEVVSCLKKCLALQFNIKQINFKTNANLNVDQLNKILQWFGMPRILSTDEEYCINQLVTLRNKIAHGENSFLIERDKIEYYISALISIYDKIILSMNDYVRHKKYLK